MTKKTPMSDATKVHDTDVILLHLKGKHGWVMARPDFHQSSGPLLNLSAPLGGASLTPDEARGVRDTIDDWLAAFDRVERAETIGSIDAKNEEG